ncbi:hypothetical protein AOQ84DRAFT_343111 [Glonium stellatum]|uniref:Zn(2)-C6 fungal-type domain-containing protein n=1 Tax=Glonium stellatum TaxID=574774 RepID=A0A8E2JR53_9PEZI|nr:hypothetical protein AOQ84DRAFT_343111 [Glonium stellatum]
MSTSRRSHRKTRTGCNNCKRRKIKCGEERPACTNCTRHSIQCDFVGTPSATTSASPGNLQTPDTDHPDSTPSVPANGATQGELPNYLVNGNALSLNLVHLELLHNFTTSTSFTLSQNPLLRTLWRINVPQIGLSYTFVMHGILSLSALHLAHFRSDRRSFYLSCAQAEHETALRAASSILPNITEDNCSALYVFAAITCVFAWASPRKPGDFLLITNDGIAEWLILFRGTRSIIDLSPEMLFNGPLGPMFRSGARAIHGHNYAINGDDHLAELRHFIEATKPDQAAMCIYNKCIEELAKSFAAVYGRDVSLFESGNVFVWLYQVESEYLMLLSKRTPEALAIFAYFCVLIKQLEFNWWIEGMSSRLISNIFYLLDEDHRLWIRWPMEEVGWIPH